MTTPMDKAMRDDLVKSLKQCVPIFVSAGGWPKLDGSKPYILLTAETRNEIVAALSPTLPGESGMRAALENIQPWCPKCRATSANDKLCGICETPTIIRAVDLTELKALSQSSKPPPPAERGCLFCRTPIAECMGFTLARDAFPPDGIFKNQPRELCQRCADLISELFIRPQPATITPPPPAVPSDEEMLAILRHQEEQLRYSGNTKIVLAFGHELARRMGRA